MKRFYRILRSLQWAEDHKLIQGYTISTPDGRRQWHVWWEGSTGKTYTTREIEVFIEGLSRIRT